MYELSQFHSVVVYLSIYIIFSFIVSQTMKSGYSKVKKKAIIILCIVLLSILFSRRFLVGTDYQTYYLLYNRYSTISFSELFRISSGSQEIGMLILYKITGVFGPNFPLFLFMSNILILTPFILGISRHKNNFNVFFAIFWFLVMDFSTSLNLIRQYISVSFSFLAIIKLLEGKNKGFWLLSIVSFLFHYSAIVLLLVYGITEVKGARFRFTMKSIFQILSISILAISIFLLIRDTSIVRRYFNYIFIQGNNSNNLSFYLSALYLIIVTIYKKRIIIKNEDFRVIYQLLWIGFVFQTFGFVSPFVKRTAIVFTVLNAIPIGYLMDIYKVKTNRILTKLLTFAFITVYFVLFYGILGYSQIVPLIFT